RLNIYLILFYFVIIHLIALTIYIIDINFYKAYSISGLCRFPEKDLHLIDFYF
ncbi:MAG: hypothetical protein RLZZ184_2362, partial [Cyanobacteriota bacterium]